MSRLEIKYDDNSSFIDYTDELENYLRDTASMTFTSAEDKLYVGYYKPISSFYVAFSTANTNSANLSVKYYNGSAFTSVSNLKDRTNGFNRDGFVEFDHNREDETTTTIDSKSAYWYELVLDADSSAMSLRGINQLFSDDLDLEGEEPGILDSDYYPASYSSYLLYHQSTRDDIIQHLRNEGHRKYNSSTTDWKNINQFDFLDRTELRQASKYWVLAKVYFNLSDAPEDKYFEKSLAYKIKGSESLNVFFLSYDKDDDGKEDDFEQVGRKFGRIIKL